MLMLSNKGLRLADGKLEMRLVSIVTYTTGTFAISVPTIVSQENVSYTAGGSCRERDSYYSTYASSATIL